MPVTPEQMERAEREAFGNVCRCCNRPIEKKLTVADRDAEDWPRCNECATAMSTFVVATIHDGTDWCVRPATDEELRDEADFCMTREDAIALGRKTATEQGCDLFDFSEVPTS